MKVEQRSGAVQSTMTGEKIQMGIAVEDMPHIMGILAGLYKDRLLAIFREYSCNASDAHVEAGISLPIEISLPSALYPTLRIRDYGCGMTAEDIRVTYSQYGRSTKRNTNDQVGMMGLGCKSALSYTNQFTVVSIKDGRKVTVLIALDEEGAGSMQILADVDSDEANGTEVQVAIRREDISRCYTVAREFFQYWATGTVLVDGAAPTRFEGLKLTDNLYLVQASASDSRIVMGNVAYPHEIDVFGGGRSYNDPPIALIAFVPIGSVKPTPSRESLMDVQRTKDTVAAILSEYESSIKGVIQREVDAAPSHQAVIRAIAHWGKVVPKAAAAAQYTYKGQPVPTGFTATPDAFNSNQGYDVELTSYPYASKAAVSYSRELPITYWPTTMWVEGFVPTKFSAQHKKKLIAHCEANELKVERFILLRRDTAPATEFVDCKMVVSWETIKAIKLEVSQSNRYGAYRIPGSYDIYTETGLQAGLPGGDIRQDKPLFWMEGNRHSCATVADTLKVFYPDFTLVCLGANRVEKFVREVVIAKPWKAGIDDAYAAWKAKLDPEDLKAIVLADQGLTSTYKELALHHGADRFNDPRIPAMIKLAERDVAELMRQRRLLSRHCTIPAMEAATVYNALDEYPLIIYRISYPDIPLYMNAKFAASA